VMCTVGPLLAACVPGLRAGATQTHARHSSDRRVTQPLALSMVKYYRLVV
jgi:hypothetical protein